MHQGLSYSTVLISFLSVYSSHGEIFDFIVLPEINVLFETEPLTIVDASSLGTILEERREKREFAQDDENRSRDNVATSIRAYIFLYPAVWIDSLFTLLFSLHNFRFTVLPEIDLVFGLNSSPSLAFQDCDIDVQETMTPFAWRELHLIPLHPAFKTPMVNGFGGLYFARYPVRLVCVLMKSITPRSGCGLHGVFEKSRV